MNDRRSYLKDLATQQADAWAASVSPSTFGGEMRIETKNTVYTFKDGACVSIARRDRAFKSDPTTIVGMRMVGWLYGDDPYAGLQHAWKPGAYAVLWRARAANETSASVALTSATTTMLAIRRQHTSPVPMRPPPLPQRSAPPPLPARASAMPRSAPPPLPRSAPPPRSSPPPLPQISPPTPARMVRVSSAPPPPSEEAMISPPKIPTPPMPTFGAIGRPPSPSHVRPRPQSMTRMNNIPPAPATPTPPTAPRFATPRATTPPPLPPRARIASGA